MVPNQVRFDKVQALSRALCYNDAFAGRRTTGGAARCVL